MSGPVARARERAAAFVTAHGDDLARQRAACLAGAEPVARCVADIERREADGHWHGVAGARELLGLLDALRVLDAPPGARAAARLAREQRTEGFWEERTGAAEAERIETTATLSGLLGKMRSARPSTLDAAAAWLAARFTSERVAAAGPGELTAWCHAFAHAPHESADEVLHQCGRALDRAFRAGALDALGAAGVLRACDAPTLPGARWEAAALARVLLEEQADDGGWPAREPRTRVARTLEALAFLARFLGDGA